VTVNEPEGDHMLVLVAITDVQGAHRGDRHCAVEGELVTPIVLECADACCEVCRSAWFGLASGRGTTTAMVADRPGVTEADVRRAIHDWLDLRGTIGLIMDASEAGDYSVDGVCVSDPVTAVSDLIDAHLAEIRQVCGHFPAGTFVSRLGSLVSARVIADAA
jgi:hypothetical protein